MLKCSVVICGVVLGIYTIVQGDTITLKSADKRTIDSRVLSNGSGDTVTLRMGSVDKDLELTVLGFTEEYVEASIEKKNIKSMKIQFIEGNKFPDVIFANNIDTAVECKIKDVAEDAIRVLIPKSAIAFLRVSTKKDSSKNKTDIAKNMEKPPEQIVEKKDTPQEKKQIPVAPLREDESNESFVNDLRTFPGEKIKGEKNYRLRTIKVKKDRLLNNDVLVNAGIEVISTENIPHAGGIGNMQELELEKGANEADRNMVKGSMDAKDITKPAEYLKGTDPTIQDLDLGWVQGKVTCNGIPLPDCQIKLQILEKGGLLTKGYHPIEGAVAFETNTDKDGMYHVMNVPPGLYKLYWKPAGETSWVRRFKMEPDIIVEAGKATNPKTVETTKRTLN
ncbi:MAG: hypothetical protein HZB37_06370 [Planctomycetes bacterium]|nr:hypothetical protein [Planctomycetota bacterium]